MSTKNTLFRRFEFIGYAAIVSLLIGLAACGGGGDRAGIAGLIPGLSILAGNMDYVGNVDGTGADARFYYPWGVATDSTGNVYVADRSNHVIRKITPTGVVSTLAGLTNSNSNYCGSADGTGSDARFCNPWSVATDSSGNVYVADTSNNKIRKVTSAGVVTTLAGSGAATFADGAGASASFAGPWGVATDNAGNVYVADTSNHRIRIITASGVVSTLAGNGAAAFADDPRGVSATSAASFSGPRAVATDNAGNVYVADTDNNRIRFITPAGAVTTIAGSGAQSNVNAVGTLASFNGPQGITFDKASGSAFVADTGNHIIRKIASAASGAASAVVTTYAGLANTSGSADGSGTSANFNSPGSVVADNAGIVYVADTFNHTIRKIDVSGTVSTFAGKAIKYGNTDAIGLDARFRDVLDVAADSMGNLYVADTSNHTIRKITAAGVVSTFAGSGVAANTDGQGTTARFNSPFGVTIDKNDNLYVVDTGNNAIRKISTTGPFAGVVSTLIPGTAGLNSPRDAAVDGVGNIYVADFNNHNIRKITPDGNMITFAGSTLGTAGYGNADGKGTAASFYNPWGIATDSTGNVYVSDYSNQTIRKITPAGNVTTLAGAVGIIGNVDGGGVARFWGPRGIVVSPAGNVYVSDTINHTIRKVTPDGIVSTVVGIAGKASFVAGGLPGKLVFPEGLAIYGTSLYIAMGNGVTVVRNLP